MEGEYTPIFLENKNNGYANGAWIHDDIRMKTIILPLAYTSDLGIIRLMVSDLDTATSVLSAEGFMVSRSSCTVEVVPDRSSGLQEIVKALTEHGVDVELTGIIPGIYQG